MPREIWLFACPQQVFPWVRCVVGIACWQANLLENNKKLNTKGHQILSTKRCITKINVITFIHFPFWHFHEDLKSKTISHRHFTSKLSFWALSVFHQMNWYLSKLQLLCTLIFVAQTTMCFVTIQKTSHWAMAVTEHIGYPVLINFWLPNWHHWHHST